MPITQSDFSTPLTGNIVVVNNGASFTIRANADLNIDTELDEQFRVVVRKGSNTGIIIGITEVLLLDTSNIRTYRILDNSILSKVIEGSNIIFTVNTINVPSVEVLYYKTLGNASNSSFVQGNTGSFSVSADGNAEILLTTVENVPTGNAVSFRLQVYANVSANPIANSNIISIIDTQLTNLQASGGTTTTSGGIRTHVFTTSGTFTVTDIGTPAKTIDYLVVAGGGGGGSGGPPGAGFAGGGGAGGLLTGSTVLSQTGPYTITVGGGGSGVGPAGGGTPNNGGTSSISVLSISSTGGGRGGSSGGTTPTAGSPGGSGGGGAAGTAGSGTPGQGNPGGGPPGGGGGGAGAAGSPTVGGIGSAIPWVPASYGTPGPAPGRYFSGGGGAGNGPGAGDLGGAGGGGRGGPAPTPPTVSPGTVNTGGGGGGSGFASTGGAGGSGIVIIRYPYA
jgi:hypothetical protein